MTDRFKIRYLGDSFDQKSRTRGELRENGGISLPETCEALGMSESLLLDRMGLPEKVQDLAAGRTSLHGIGGQILDDILDEEHDPLPIILYADMGVSLPTLLALEALGVTTRVEAHRTHFRMRRERHDGRFALIGGIALNSRVSWDVVDRAGTGSLTVRDGLSDTMSNALIGEPLSSLISHPRLDPLGLTITDAVSGSSGTRFDTDYVAARLRMGDVRK